MADDFYSGIYNPDVLSCIANLSNDEVFTPPDVANAMLDLLPQELFASTETTFLDPACKSGVFLREIAKRLLAAHFPGYKEALDAINAKKSAGTALTAAEETYLTEFQAGVDHIFHHQLFGIAITELTSLLSRRGVYCSKFPNGEYSVSHFDDAEGNIRFKRIQHRWKDGKCVFCGANQSQYDRDDSLETHAYEWIHTTKPEEILKMKFDVIISNPPYQLSDGGNNASARPIYQLFVNQAKKLMPRYISMIIPSRWFSGGKGLDSFRADMLSDSRISTLVDYENSDEIFNGVDIAGGICYFLWDKDHSGPCKVINFYNKEPAVSIRKLNEYDTFIRHDKAVEIVHKVQIMHGKNKYLDSRVSARKPFGLPTNYEQSSSGVPCWFIQRIGLKLASAKDVVDTNGYLSKWKLLIPPAPIAGQTDFSKPVGFYYDGNTRIAKPGECCTESWLVARSLRYGERNTLI
jgi:site-specific DNA-methyltransferase (adenine-specific)